MKEITIFQENIEPLILNDSEDETDLNTYTQELSNLLELSTLTILNISSCSIILRPSKINSIKVRNVDNKELEESQSKQNENIITDM